MNEEWVLNISLKDAGLILLWTIVEFVKKAFFDFLQIIQNLNAMTTIGFLARLDNPPTVFFEGVLEGFKFVVLEDITSLHFLR